MEKLYPPLENLKLKGSGGMEADETWDMNECIQYNSANTFMCPTFIMFPLTRKWQIQNIYLLIVLYISLDNKI